MEGIMENFSPSYLIEEKGLVRAKLSTMLSERGCKLKSNLQDTPKNGIIKCRVIIEKYASIEWNCMTVSEI